MQNQMDEVEEVKSSPMSAANMTPKTSKSPLVSRFMATPLGSPMKAAMTSMRGYLEESRNGNALYSAFHTLSPSGIGIPALLLPLSFATLGWKDQKLISLHVCIYAWHGELYVSQWLLCGSSILWLLIQLHESESGMGYSRYLRLSMAAFVSNFNKKKCNSQVENSGIVSNHVPLRWYVTLIMIGGGTMKIFFQIVCGETCRHVNPLSTIERYLLFTGTAILLAQLPNLNSIAGISLIGAITAVSYCTLIWVVSVTKDIPNGVSYKPLETKSDAATVFSVLNELGITTFAFRGHNPVLEIQGTMPSSSKRPSRLPTWEGVIPFLNIQNRGMLNALNKYHGHDTSKFVLGLTSMLVVVNNLSSLQIYAMLVFDNLEFRFTSSVNKPCPWWLRSGFRIFFGCFAFFVSIFYIYCTISRSLGDSP
ncbi:unnamed protein product [Malus baccata var. baccata]